jgi:hypothetical protein
MSNRTLDIDTLRRHVGDAEFQMLLLQRQLTDAIVAKRPTGALSTEIAEIAEAHDFMAARLARLEGEEGGRRPNQDRQA